MDRTKTPFLLIIALAIAFSIPVFPIRWHMLWHIFGAIVFLGNLIVSAAWMTTAHRTDDPGIVAFAARMVARADWMFTAPSIILILLNGFALSGKLYGWANFHEQAWLTTSLGLFVVSGVIWAVFLWRYQAAMIRLSSHALSITPELRDAIRKWGMWGGIATFLPLIALWLMVAKPALWG